MTRVERVATLLAAHQARFHGMSATCSCGKWGTTADESPEGHDEPHRLHIAAILEADGLLKGCGENCNPYRKSHAGHEVGVQTWADQLRQHATHFVQSDWQYTRDLGGLTSLRYDRHEDTVRGRLRSAARWLTRRRQPWESAFEVTRFQMARHALRRDRHLPDGVLDNGGVIVIWEETGEYLQYVQPSVGAILADWMDADPDSPHAQRIAAEMKRINDRYGERIAAESGEVSS